MRNDNGREVKDFISKITPEMVDSFWKSLREKAEWREAWFKTDLCQRMILDVSKSDHGLDAEDFSYFPDRVRNRLGWGDLSDDTIEQFIETMSDASFGVEAFIHEPNPENPFPHWVYLKAGLLVFTMSGQGTIHWFQSTDLDPEMHERLKAVAKEQPQEKA